jgi:hypothetical protein
MEFTRKRLKKFLRAAPEHVIRIAPTLSITTFSIMVQHNIQVTATLCLKALGFRTLNECHYAEYHLCRVSFMPNVIYAVCRK